jgi:hypothetical protein
MKFHNRLSKLERCLPVPADEPADWYAAHLGWLAEMPRGDEMTAYFNETIWPAMGLLIADGVGCWQAYTQVAMTAEHHSHWKMVYDACVWMMEQPKFQAMLKACIRDLERSEAARKRNRAGRGGWSW